MPLKAVSRNKRLHERIVLSSARRESGVCDFLHTFVGLLAYGSCLSQSRGGD
jgi:hypothetical protein